MGARIATLALLIGCAPAQPGWSSGHPADPDAPAGAEEPIAEVLRAEPPAAPESSDEGEHDGHHGSHDAPMEENHAQ